MFVESPVKWEVDPLVRSLTVERLGEDVAEYEALLNSNASEHRVHEFLASHSYFFNTYLRLFGASPLYSKIKLGSDYEVDFAWFDSGSFGPEWRLVEIEAPSHRLYTDGGQPSAALTHAIQQVRDWHTWIHENLRYARKLMPWIEYPLGFVFMGRWAELTDSTKQKLKRLCHENRMFLEIHTLDSLAGCARSVRDLVERERGGNWPVPMKALTHHDLAQGLPPLAQWFMKYPADEGLTQRRIRDREFKYVDDSKIY